MTIFFVTVGVYKTMSLQREAYPAVDFDFLYISTDFPGASPREVELYVTNPIEKEIKNIDGVLNLNSTSIEGRSIVVIKLDIDAPDEDNDKTIDKIRTAVANVTDLPDDLPRRPYVGQANSSTNFPVLEVNVSGDLPYETIHKHADQLADKLETIENVFRVNKLGYQQKEYWVEVSQEKLNRYGLGLSFQPSRLETSICLVGL